MVVFALQAHCDSGARARLRMIDFFRDHWLGRNALGRSVFNLIASYLLAVIVVVSIGTAIPAVSHGPGFYALLIFFLLVLLWGVVGTTISALGSLRAIGTSFASKLAAFLVLAAEVALAYLFVKDLNILVSLLKS